MMVLLALLLVAADQATKRWATLRFGPGGGPEQEIGLGFSLTYARNEGAAFGILRDLSVPVGPLLLDGTLLLGLLSAAVTLGLLIYLLARGRRVDALTRLALALVLAGAAGNMIDRLTLRYVVDWIHFQVGWFDFPVFNLADTCVVIGAGLLLLAGLRPERTPEPPRGRYASGIRRSERSLEEADFFGGVDGEREG